MGAMRQILAGVTLLLAPVAALAAGAMGFEDARHLLNRAGFAASIDDIDAFAGLSRSEAADRLLGGTTSEVLTPAPAWANDFVPPRHIRAMGEEERRAFLRDQRDKGLELRSWWLSEMLVTPSPLTEKMVLFWHNHFVSSLQKVRSPALMYRQHMLLRRHAFGYFGDFLHDIARDPAMVIYLDSASNRKGQPNENFAREVMELFTLGEGNYAEQDIKEAARAFTGWSIDQETGEFMFRAPAHDEGIKTVLGRSGSLDGDAVIDILLAQPQTAEFIVSKLWREFVSPTPDPIEIKRIARMFRDNRYSIRVTLRALLVSDAFYAPRNRAALIKSPVELIIGTLRQFRFETGAVTPFALAARQLGQDLFAPPNVRGWRGGEAWINGATLLARRQLLERLFRAPEMTAAPVATGEPAAPGNGTGNLAADRERFLRATMGVRFDGDKWLTQFTAGGPPVTRVVLAADPLNSINMTLEGRELLRQLVLDPVYQLK